MAQTNQMISQFLPAGGIDPEVVRADIEHHAGSDATVQIDNVRSCLPGYGN